MAPSKVYLLLAFAALAVLAPAALGQGENRNATKCRDLYVGKVATANWTQQIDLVDTYTACLDKVYGSNGTRRLLSEADNAYVQCDTSYKASVEWIDESEVHALAALKEAWKTCKDAAKQQKEAEIIAAKLED